MRQAQHPGDHLIALARRHSGRSVHGAPARRHWSSRSTPPCCARKAPPVQTFCWPVKSSANASTVFSGMGLAAIFRIHRRWPEDESPPTLPWPSAPSGIALGMEVYPALLGVGCIVGPKTASYMFTGSLVGWMVVIPLICLFGANISLCPAAAGTTVADLYAAGGADAIWSSCVEVYRLQVPLLPAVSSTLIKEPAL
ncbi:MAG: hypothetical protein ACLVJH_19030 [Faecalibacterium prausnitzii]